MVAKLPGFAPFSTSGRRNNLVSESKRNLPAPGSYELELDLLSSAVAAAGSSFNSKVGRFNAKDSIRDGPGPSAYILPSTLNAQLHQGKKTLRSQTASAEMLQKLKEMSNVAIVPAIPRREQSHGYEPMENGRLVLQEPAFVPVPNTDPDLRFLAGKQNTKSVVFSNSPRQPMSEDPLRKSFAPGPGTYNHPSIFEAPTGGSGSSNYKHDYVVRLNEVKTAFESKTLRDSIGDEIKRRFAPGPQEYDVPSGMKVETRPVKNQFFSSSVQRFTNPVLQANRIYTSPGDYNPLTSDFDKLQLKVMKQKKMARYRDLRHPPHNQTPINTITSLYYRSFPYSSSPYTILSPSPLSFPHHHHKITSITSISLLSVFINQSINRSISRSLWAQQVAFEGTERRFNEVNSGIPKDWIGNRAPAPGAYDPNNNFGVEFSKPTALPQTFGSKDTRFRQARTWKSDALEKPRQGVAESSLLASSLDIPQPLPQSSPAKMARFMAEKDKDLSMLRGNIVRGGTAPFINNSGSSVASASMNLGVTFPKSKGK